jgi:hypothetical protein
MSRREPCAGRTPATGRAVRHAEAALAEVSALIHAGEAGPRLLALRAAHGHLLDALSELRRHRESEAPPAK